jgi:hypothetical protein
MRSASTPNGSMSSEMAAVSAALFAWLMLPRLQTTPSAHGVSSPAQITAASSCTHTETCATQ